MSADLSSAKRIVVKTGSSLMVDEAGDLRQAWLGALTTDIAALRQSGCEVILVTSGAIAIGRRVVGALAKPAKTSGLSTKQAAAAVGQPLLMQALSAAFSAQEITLAQSLLTLEDTERRRRWLNARATLETLLSAKIVPIINENDTVATDEIRYGDNDRLAARVAQMISADVLVLLSDVDGLYTADPSSDPGAEHIAELDELTPKTVAMGGPANLQRGVGSGGMATKLAAAQIAFGAGCQTVITLGDRDHPLMSLTKGEKATWIRPAISPDSARRSWLRGHLTPEGSVRIDAGAAEALANGASLLPVGILHVAGSFERGAAIAVHTEAGQPLGKGVAAYSAADIERIKGLKTDEVETLLGFHGRPAVIHRDDLVLD